MIKILGFRKMQKEGSLRGFAKISINGIIINDCTVMLGKNGIFCGMPSRKYQDKDGNTKYANYVELPREIGAELTDVVLAYLDNGTAQTQEVPQNQVNNDVPF